MSPEMIEPKVLNYASILDEGTRAQAKALGELPFVYDHVALMPDAHFGKGSSVGTVIPTRGAIIPAAVGVDIGCGVSGIKTNLTKSDVEANIAKGNTLLALREAIEADIPMSKGNYNDWGAKYEHTTRRMIELQMLADKNGVDLAHSPKWRQQLGTLGSGNHFIEACYDEYDGVWLILHSGSRGVGNQIAKKHIKIAQKLCAQWFIELADPDHAYLPHGTDEFWRYIKDLHWAQEFALQNRGEMLDRTRTVFADWMGVDSESLETQRIESHHNYTQQVEIKGKKVWLTRKGAVDASIGKRGIIPGSMGTRSYVTIGKGDEASFNSAPHGAGRMFSRTEARKRFTLEDLDREMDGIEYKKGEEWIDEIPSAYKDIDVIMRDSSTLVTVEYVLRQFVNCKGM